MNDLISRQAAIESLHRRFRDGFDEDKWWNSTIVLSAINETPPAQPEQNTGRWEKVYGDHIRAGHRPWTLCCSECGMIGDGTNYCPNCGAYMGGGHNGETD